MPSAPLSTAAPGPISRDSIGPVSPAKRSWPASRPPGGSLRPAGALAAALMMMLFAGTSDIRRKSREALPRSPMSAGRGQGGAPRRHRDGRPRGVGRADLRRRGPTGRGRPPDRRGAALGPGRLRLAQGWVQIEFVSGAGVILEGPATWIITPGRAFCHRGKLHMHVPTHATASPSGPPGRGCGGPRHRVRHPGRRGGGGARSTSSTARSSSTGPGAARRPGRHEPEGRVGCEFGPTSAPRDRRGPGRVRRPGPAPAAGRRDQQRRHDRWKAENWTLRSDPATLLYYGFDDPSPWQRTLRGGGRDQAPNGAVVGCPGTEGRWPGKGRWSSSRISDRVRIDVPGQFDR